MDAPNGLMSDPTAPKFKKRPFNNKSSYVKERLGQSGAGQVDNWETVSVTKQGDLSGD